MPHFTKFASRIKRDSTLVYDLRVTIQGLKCFYIVNIIPAKRAAFLAAINKDQGYQLTDYGTILYKGWGEPSNALKMQLREEYGMYANEDLVFDNVDYDDL